MLYLRGQIYWIAFRHAGRLIRISTGARTRREAERAAREIRHAYDKKHGPQGRLTGVPLTALAELDQLRAAAAGLSARRQKTLDEMWRPLLAHFGERHDATALTPAAILDYTAARHASVKGQTIRRELGCLRRAIREARIRGIMSRDPIDWDLLPRIRNDGADPARRGKLWADHEIARILEHLSPRAVTAGIRDRCALIMLTGLRKEELDRLRPEWITLTPSEQWPAVLALPAEGAKWGRPRSIPLCAAALEIVRAHARDGQPTVFALAVKPNRALASASARAGFVRTLTPRDLRTWYLNAIERAAGVVLAQRLGGHSSIATTGLYLRADERRAMSAGIAVADAAIAAICITPTDHGPQTNGKNP